jgi:serine protease
MRNVLRKYAIGSLAVGVIAGGTALALPGVTASWQPVRYGLSASPAQLLPADVSSAHPVRVVGMRLDAAGRPVVTVRTATDRTTAVSLVKDAQKAKNAVGVEVDATVTAIGVPTGSDPSRGQQWDLTKIKATDAWQQSTGAGVTVAVIDTGVDARHPDLAGQVLTGYDVINKSTGIATDPNGHGTHVAGTIAAATGNGVGVSAVAPDTTILPIRVLGAGGTGYMSDAATGIIYAADHGANVINMSLGSTSKVTAVSNAIAYARSKGVTVVAAAGNQRESGSPTSYPAADAGVIAVAATDSADAAAFYSNEASYVDVAAPGSAIYNTYPGNRYATMSGTSMASPHVAAVAALLKAYNPSLTPDQIEAALEESAKDLGAAGKDADYGYGRIDAVAALAAVTVPAATAPATSAAASTPTTVPATTVPTTTGPAPSATVTTAPSASPTVSATPAPTSTVTPAPTKTATAPKLRPVIKVISRNTKALYGSTATVSYTVTVGNKAFARQPVRVGTAEGNRAFVYRDATTDAAGKLVVSRVATARFRVRLVIGETATSLPVTSPTSVITVHSRAALTSRSTGTLTASASSSMTWLRPA